MTGRSIGAYTIVRSIGRGGMGEVFEAQAANGVRVALKTMTMPDAVDPSARWQAVERFQREARAARALEHPHIVSVVDVGEDAGTFYIVMEHLDGQSVRELLDMAGTLSVERARAIVGQVCEALAYAHARNVIHRDIKPNNIMVLRDGRAKLMDFGLAAITVETGMTETGTVLGTFRYMSPEQARGLKLDARSDLFSLGATFHEMLTGRPPFAGATPGAIVASILNDEPAPIAGAPPEVQRAVAQCLCKDPEKRCQCARDLLAVLSPGATVVEAGALAARPPEAPGSVSAIVEEEAPVGARPTLEARRQLHVEIACPGCGERWTPGRATCWKCGRPDPRKAHNRVERAAQEAIMEAVKKMAPRRRKWWRFGR